MKMNKLAKFGIVAASIVALGGVVAPVGWLMNTHGVVYAQDAVAFHPYVVEFYIDGEYWGVTNRGYNPGWPYVALAPYSEEFPGREWPNEELGGFTSNLPNISNVTKEDLDRIGGAVKVYWTKKPVETPPVEKPVETPPAEKPVETPPVEKPVETPPAEKPVETPPAKKPVGKTAVKPSTAGKKEAKAAANTAAGDGFLAPIYVALAAIGAFFLSFRKKEG